MRKGRADVKNDRYRIQNPEQPQPGGTRRDFLWRTACAAVGLQAVSSTLFDLRRVASAACTPSNDYKAMICLFLYGGNDGNNIVVPRSGADYSAYAIARQALALPSGVLLPITPLNPPPGDTRQWGLHPQLPNLRNLFNAQKAAVVANVGPLVAPITRADYLAESSALPPQLFSHSDQTAHWMTSWPDQIPTTGWGGRMADRINALNLNSQVSMSMSLDGTNIFQVGSNVTQVQISNDGSIGLWGYEHQPDWNHPPTTAINAMVAKSYGNLLERAYARVVDRAIDNDQLLRQAFEWVDANGGVPQFSDAVRDTNLGSQLYTIARLIKARGQLCLTRQVFFAASGGYDTHDDQVASGSPQTGSHADLLGEMDAAIGAFQAAMDALGIPDKVTLFTASDFGRTYKSNLWGSDHGWGGHHFVVGGAVRGGRMYGRMPQLVMEGPDDTEDGRWIPTVSVDEYSATLARWFGVAPSELAEIFPNIGNFASSNLGFMV
jgi:uncharacterized protein (DUF1501 family)